MASLKTRIFITAAAVLFFALAAPVHAGDAAVSAVVTYAKGKVQVLPAGSKTWGNLKMGQFVYEGDTVRTGPASRAGITYTGGIENRLNANTTFKVMPEEQAGKGEGNKIEMLFGRIWTKILKKGTKFEIHTPVAVCSVRGTEYETDVENNGHTDVKVYEGVVQLSNEYGSKNVSKNSKCSVSAGSPPAEPTPMGGGEKENWQDEMNASGSLKLETDGALEAGKANDGTVTVLDKKGVTDEKYSKKLTLSSDNTSVNFSPAGSEAWAAKLEAVPSAGKLGFKVKFSGAPGAGSFNITVAGEDLGASVLKISARTASEKKLKVKIKTDDGKEKELHLKFKAE